MDEGVQKSFSAMERLKKLFVGWRDVQQEFAVASGISRLMNLGKAIDLCGLSFEGHEHDALDDAAATAELFYELTEGMTKRKIRNAMHSDEEHLGLQLGLLLSDIYAVA